MRSIFVIGDDQKGSNVENKHFLTRWHTAQSGFEVVVVRLLGRPFLKFVYLFLVRLGFLDGRPWLVYCRLRPLYESMIVLKMRELAAGRTSDIEPR